MIGLVSPRALSRAFPILLFTLLATSARAQLVASGPLDINGQSGTVIQNLHITNPNGDCVTLSNSSNITIRASEIGPCKGNGIVITGGTSISVLDNYIHPEGQLAGCCDVTDGILTNGTSNLTVQGNVIAYGEANIEAAGQTNIKIVGNFFLNPRGGANSRGQNIQVWNNNSGVTVQNNYTLASTDTTKYKFAEVQEDSINFGPNTSGIVVQGNYVTGGHSPSGCGVIADTGVVSGQFLSNTLLNTGQCGIGITSGVNVLVDSNKVLNTTPVSGGGNTAIYVWKTVSSDSCGPVQVSNNIASAITIQRRAEQLLRRRRLCPSHADGQHDRLGGGYVAVTAILEAACTSHTARACELRGPIAFLEQYGVRAVRSGHDSSRIRPRRDCSRREHERLGRGIGHALARRARGAVFDSEAVLRDNASIGWQLHEHGHRAGHHE